MVGTRLGSYDIIAPIGAGGMGEAFRAKDTRLGRDVALKVLPSTYAADPDRIARFQREAQVLASLNHPHIAAIYGLEEADGVRALVLELVEGETLADRIARGPITVDEALVIARQIAEALEAAHEQGIIHRDLKPANIKVNPDGRVKVLDFGLAKLAGPPAAFAEAPAAREGGHYDGRSANPSTASMSPTITTPAMTHIGMILGTAAYMSPEQAKGKPADKRSDIWAFGCVLHEMLTGRRTFNGDDVSETLASVLKDEPRWEALPADLPSSVRHALRAMLQRDRSRRLSSVPPLLFEATLDAPAPRSSRRLVAAAIAAAALVAIVAAYGFMSSRQPAQPRPVKRVLLSPGFGRSLERATAIDPDIAIARSGSHIAYVVVPPSNTPQLFIRDLRQLAPVQVKTEAAPRSPFFSPDGEWIAFFDGPTLKKVKVDGNAPVPIVNNLGTSRGGTWLDDDRIVFATDGLRIVPAGGGSVQALTEAARGAEGQQSHRWPERLPGRNAVLFTIWKGTGQQADVAVLDLETKKWQVVINGGTNGRFVSSGHLLYGAAGRLHAVAFDLDTLTVVGKSVPIDAEVRMKLSGAVMAAAADDGSLVYFTGEATARRSFYWVDGKGNSTRAVGLPEGEVVHPRLSPDGSRLVYTRQDDEYDLWVYDFKRGTSERLTFLPEADRDAVWSPDGQRIAYFASGAPEGSGIVVISADGGQPRRLTTGNHRPTSWSADGKQVVFVIVPGERATNDIAAVNVDGEPKIAVLLATGAAETLPAVSPKGQWMAYRSSEAGVNAIYVRPFAGGTRRRISPDVGDQPFWGADGTLYYRTGNRIMAVRNTSGPIDTWSAPALAFEFPISLVDLPRNVDVAPDGRFLVLRDENEEGNNRELVLVENWLSEVP
jgi:serine/threonine-protein kinase